MERFCCCCTTNTEQPDSVHIRIQFELDVIVHLGWTVYVCERAMLNMITDGNDVCLCVCLCMYVCL